jgi:hypothetical protein
MLVIWNGDFCNLNATCKGRSLHTYRRVSKMPIWPSHLPIPSHPVPSVSGPNSPTFSFPYDAPENHDNAASCLHATNAPLKLQVGYTDAEERFQNINTQMPQPAYPSWSDRAGWPCAGLPTPLSLDGTLDSPGLVETGRGGENPPARGAYRLSVYDIGVA